MKEIYISPKMEIVEFESEDIITNSTPFAPYAIVRNGITLFDFNENGIPDDEETRLQ